MGTKSVLAGAIAGAGIMYFADPKSGNRRRAVFHDKTRAYLASEGEMLDRIARDIQNRWSGSLAAMTSCCREELVADDVLARRVRSIMGRVVSHPKAVDVMVKDGNVTLYGPVLTIEVDRLVKRIRSIPGVRGVENRLEAQKRAGNEPSLQGGRPRPELSDFTRTNWSPAARLAAMIAGWGLSFYGARRGAVLGTVVALTGVALAARGVYNVSVSRQFRIRPEQKQSVA